MYARTEKSDIVHIEIDGHPACSTSLSVKTVDVSEVDGDKLCRNCLERIRMKKKAGIKV